jgi:predicted enzyme related to lactoylglutathione lyase
VSFRPAGFGTVTPRIFVTDVDACVAFLRSVFDAVGDVEPGRPVELRIGDSLVMVSGLSDVRPTPFPAFLYVYVDDADAVYERAVAAGAETLEPPADQFYGDRRAMVADPQGNVFQIAHHLTS